jgi:broad specificity phosphatase PhoE
MGVLLLVRHGQGSVGTSNYDQLSERGRRQSRLVGARLARADLQVSQTWCGALARQRETADAVLAELGLPMDGLHVDARLDEYDHLGILAADGTGDPFASAVTPQARRALQSVLDEAIVRWIAGGTDYPEPHRDFTARVDAAVAELTALPGTTMAVTSAGVIGVACARLTGLPADRWPALARVVVNTSITKLITGRTGTHLLTFNDHAHLEDDRSLVTYR